MTFRYLLLIVLLLVPATAHAQESSKHIFAQARAAPTGSPEAIAGYHRYTELEPQDAWGFLALAEALAGARRFDEALAAVARAEMLAPREADVAIVRTRVERARRSALPAIKPVAYYTRDTDANTSLTLGAAGDVSMSSRWRAGVLGTRTSTDNGALSATVERMVATLALRTSTVRWNTELGGARITHDRARTVPTGQTHLHVGADNRGFAADVRVRHTPVTTAYSLVNTEALLTEARGVLDVPLFGRLKLRGAGQLGSIETSTLIQTGQPRPGRGNQNSFMAQVDRNQRSGWGGGLVLPYSPVSEMALTAYRLQYQKPSNGSYFAPEYVDVVELATYAEIYRFDPLTIALDAGVGAQRAKPFGQPEGDVTPAFRLWTQLSAPMAKYVELNVEFDFYRSQLSTVTTSAGWHSLAGGLSLRWLIG